MMRILVVLSVLLAGTRHACFAAVLTEDNIRIAQEQGPNMCVVEEVPGTKHKIWTECKYWTNRDICGRKAIIRYDCCEGYTRVDGRHGCTGVLPLADIVETARAAGASRFANILTSSGLADLLRREESASFTLFAPSDEAMESLTIPQHDALRNANAYNPILLYHIIQNKHTSQSWGADQLLPTRLRDTLLRINKYSSKIETANCVPIVRKDQEASNGVVHIINKVLDPQQFHNFDLARVVMEDGRFRHLTQLMQRSQLFDTLRRQNVVYTFLAPNDEAFQKIPASRLQRIEADENAREALLRHLVLPHPVCVGAILGSHKFPTRGQERLSFDCDDRGVSVENQRFGGDMELGLDGLLYMLDDIPMPDRVKTLVQLLEQERLYSFLDLVRSSGMDTTLDGPGDFTLFVPSEAAMTTLPQGYLNHLRTNRQEAHRFVTLHIIQKRLLTEAIPDNKVEQSMDGTTGLRLQVYRKSYGIEDALIGKKDIHGINGVLHVISKALRPANYTVEEILRQDGNYTMFLRALDRLHNDAPSALDLRVRGGSYTFLVPTDQAFQRLGVNRLDQLFSNTTVLARTLKNHVVNDMMSTESFREQLQYNVPSKQDNLHFNREGATLRVNDATVLTCDRTNRDGIVHYINKVLVPEDRLQSGHHRVSSSQTQTSRLDGRENNEADHFMEGRHRLNVLRPGDGRSAYEGSSRSSTPYPYEDGSRSSYPYTEEEHRSYEVRVHPTYEERRTYEEIARANVVHSSHPYLHNT